MILQPSFLVPGGLLGLLGLKINRGVHFVTNFAVASVALHMAIRPIPGLFEFEIGADVIAFLPALAAILGLITAALLVKAVFIGRFTLGLVGASLAASLILSQGGLVPAAGWGEAIMDQIHGTVGLGTEPKTVPEGPTLSTEAIAPEDGDTPDDVVPVTLIPRLDTHGLSVAGIDPLVASFIALGIGVLVGIGLIFGDYRSEAFGHALLGGVLVGMGVGLLWPVGAVLLVGGLLQWWTNRPDKKGSAGDHTQRATKMWEQVQAAGQIPGD